MIHFHVESGSCKEEGTTINLTLRSLLEGIGRGKAAAHCPVDPTSLRFNLTAFEVVKTLYFGSWDYLGDK